MYKLISERKTTIIFKINLLGFCCLQIFDRLKRNIKFVFTYEINAHYILKKFKLDIQR